MSVPMTYKAGIPLSHPSLHNRCKAPSRPPDSGTVADPAAVGTKEDPANGQFRFIDRAVRHARGRRRPQAALENRALHTLAECMDRESGDVLSGLLSLAAELVGGGEATSTAGVSLLESLPDGTQQFRWVALAGRLASAVGGTTPRTNSPCGQCLDLGEPIVLARPDLKYVYFQAAGVEFTEGLVVPFATAPRSGPSGTIWVVSHPPAQRRFDDEDVRLMASLAGFASRAYALADSRGKLNGSDEPWSHAVPLHAAGTRDGSASGRSTTRLGTAVVRGSSHAVVYANEKFRQSIGLQAGASAHKSLRGLLGEKTGGPLEQDALEEAIGLLDQLRYARAGTGDANRGLNACELAGPQGTWIFRATPTSPAEGDSDAIIVELWRAGGRPHFSQPVRTSS